jgi:hypothetical protein
MKYVRVGEEVVPIKQDWPAGTIMPGEVFAVEGKKVAVEFETTGEVPLRCIFDVSQLRKPTDAEIADGALAMFAMMVKHIADSGMIGPDALHAAIDMQHWQPEASIGPLALEGH